eukprot:UN28332
MKAKQTKSAEGLICPPTLHVPPPTFRPLFFNHAVSILRVIKIMWIYTLFNSKKVPHPPTFESVLSTATQC